MKRHKALQPLSREHHHGLLLCWKIRQGLKRDIEPERIKRYADWFWKNQLIPHFISEEKFVFPVLGRENKLVKKALAQHRRLKSLFERPKEVDRSLNLIEEELEGHIRFEERVLFNEIQKTAGPDELAGIERQHGEEVYCENWPDEFWKGSP